MTTYTWTDNTMRSGSTCDVDKVADNLMHLKYNAGGLLPINNLGTKTSNFTLDVNKINITDITASLAISLPTTGFISGVENKCVLNFTTTSTSSPTLPTGLKWSNKNGGNAPTAYSTTSGVRNVLIFTTIDGGTTWEADYETFGAVEVAFSQPILSADGTLGGTEFAVAVSYYYATYYGFKVSDNNPSTSWMTSAGNTCILYNPIPVKATSISFQNIADGTNTILQHTIYGSNDNITYTTLASTTNANTTASATWSTAITSGNQAFYKYYKILVSTGSHTYMGASAITINGTYIQT